jgi:hypothetical protein
LHRSIFDHVTALSPPNTRRPEHLRASSVIRFPARSHSEEDIMDFGKGALLWLLGVPLPIILLLALFWHH